MYIDAEIKRCQDIVKLIFELTGNEGFIAGGFARYCLSKSEDPIIPHDIDVFCGNDDAYARVLKRFQVHPRCKQRSHSRIETKFEYRLAEGFHLNAYMIQVIKPGQIKNMVSDGNYDRVLDNFDFTIAKAAIIPPGVGRVHENFHKHDMEKLLVIQNIHCPLSSTKRVIKYCQKGFHIETKEILKLFEDYEKRAPEWKQLIKRGLTKSEEEAWSDDEQKAFAENMYFD